MLADVLCWGWYGIGAGMHAKRTGSGAWGLSGSRLSPLRSRVKCVFVVGGMQYTFWSHVQLVCPSS